MNVLCRESSEKTLHCEEKLMNRDDGAFGEDICQIRERRKSSPDCQGGRLNLQLAFRPC